MKTIMIAVNPPHAGNLVDGVKTVEWRTKPLPCPCKALVYETKKYGGSGKIVGEVEVAGRAPIRVTSLNSHYFKGFILDGMVGIDFLEKYAKSRNAELLYANVTQSGKRYDTPKELSEFWRPCPFKTEDQDNDCIQCDAAADSDTGIVCTNRVWKAPQSWCYVEEI